MALMDEGKEWVIELEKHSAKIVLRKK